MVIGMATSKITISLPDDQIKEVRKLIRKGRISTFSGFVRHALKWALNDMAEWRYMLAESLDRTGGPLTKKEQAWAESMLTPRKARRRPASRAGTRARRRAPHR
jgi:Arc/MetJ-type ribon-helix-helix transcriptional regulator